MDHYSPAYVQKQLGHHSITMTVDIYGHWIPGEGRKDLGKTLRGKTEVGRKCRAADLAPAGFAGHARQILGKFDPE